MPAWPLDEDVAEFLAMGGYAAYVWSAFGFTLLVMGSLLLQSWLLARRRDRELAELRARVRPARQPQAARPLVARRQGAPNPDLRETA